MHYLATAKITTACCMRNMPCEKEENEEYLLAAQKGNLEEIADALGDMLYILCGTILTHGLQDKIEDV